MLVSRRTLRARWARRTGGPGPCRARRVVRPASRSTLTTAVLSGLGGIRDLLRHLLRRGLAREQLLHRVVDGLPDRGRVRLVEVELHEGRLAARVENGLHVRVLDRALGALGDRQDGPALAALVRDLGADEVLDEVDSLRRRVLTDREAVAAAELLALLADAALHLREREPAEVLAQSLLVLRVCGELV